jgi:hypothetical protein
VAVWSKTYVCGRAIAGITGWNPAEGMDVSVLFVVRSVGSVRCDELITRSEEFYRVRVSNCV